MMRKRVVSYTVVRIDLSEEVACELTNNLKETGMKISGRRTIQDPEKKNILFIESSQ